MGVLKNIVNGIGTLIVLVKLIEPVRDLVIQVERPGNGEAKKAAVLELIETAIDIAGSQFNVNLPKAQVLAFAASIIDVIVKIENTIGNWKNVAEAA